MTKIHSMAPSALDASVFALATSRLSRLITDDYVAEPVRKWMSSKGEAMEYLSTCPACTSMYTGLVVAFLPRKVRMILAASEMTVLLRKIEGKLEDPTWAN